MLLRSYCMYKNDSLNDRIRLYKVLEFFRSASWSMWLTPRCQPGMIFVKEESTSLTYDTVDMEVSYMALVDPPTSQTASHVAPCVAPDTALMLLFCQALLQAGAVGAAIWNQREGVGPVHRINHAAHPARLSQAEGLEFACLAVATSPLTPAALYKCYNLSAPPSQTVAAPHN